MNNLFKLLKINCINSLGLNAFKKDNSSNKEKSKLIKSFSLIVLGAVAVCYVAYVYADLIGKALVKIGFINMLPILAVIVATLAVFFTSIYKAPGTLFSSKDYELLMSLPISSKSILASKVINLLSLNMGLTAVILVPTTVVFYENSNASILSFLYCLIGIFVIPLIPSIIASIVAFLLSYVSSKSRFSNIVSLIGMLIIMLFIFIGSYKIEDLLNYFAKNASSIEELLRNINPIAGWYGDLMAKGSLMALIKIVGVSAIAFTIFIIVFSRSFKKINSRLGESYKKANYKITTLKTNTPFKALIEKEIRRYLSCNIYVFNTAFGAILLLLAAIATIFMKDKVVEIILGEKVMAGLIPLIFIVFFSFIATTLSTTASTISLEGKNFWILKVLPVDTMDIFKSKIAVTLLLGIPAIIVSSIIMKFSLRLSWINLLWLMVIPSLFVVFIAIVGLFINLNFPKFDWTQEVRVVKQSLSVMITIFGGMGIIALAVGAFVLLEPKNYNVFLAAITVILFILNGFAWSLLKTKGVKLFKSL